MIWHPPDKKRDCLRIHLARNCSKALEVCRGLLEGVDGRKSVGARTVWHEIRVFLLRFWPARRASAAGCGVEAVDLANTMFVHAILHEEILTPRAKLPVLFASLRLLFPTGSCTRVGPFQEDRHGLFGDYLEVAEKTLLHTRAILEVEAVAGFIGFGCQIGAKLRWKEDC